MVFFLLAGAVYSSLGIWAGSWAFLPPEPEVWVAYAIGWLPLLVITHALVQPEHEWRDEWKLLHGVQGFSVKFTPVGGRWGWALAWLTLGLWPGKGISEVWFDDYSSWDSRKTTTEEITTANFWRCKFIASQTEQTLDDKAKPKCRLIRFPQTQHLRRCA